MLCWNKGKRDSVRSWRELRDMVFEGVFASLSHDVRY